MKRSILAVLVLLLAPAWAPPASGQSETTKLLADVAKATRNALVTVECSYEENEVKVLLTGMGVCYDAAKGEFMTFAFGGSIKPENIKKLRLILPGHDRKSIEAEFLGIRPEARIGFVRAKEKHNWQAVRFAGQSNLSIGQAVVSAGLMPGDPANSRYFGAAYVAASMRTPGVMHYVTAGRLTCVGSPVFRADGLAVGIVQSQPYMQHQMATNRGPTNVALRAREESAFFTPVEEFVYVLKRIPRQGRVPRLPWIGAQIVSVGAGQAELIGVDRPAAQLDQVIPGYPAEKAGLKPGNIIVGFNGKPLERLATPDLVARNLLRQIVRIPSGQTITLTVLRDLKPQDVSLVLTDMPTRPAEAPRYANKALGIILREKVHLDQYLDRSPTARMPGLVVIGVAKREPPIELASGDLVTMVNDQPVTTVATFKKLVEESLAADPNRPVVVIMRRGAEGPKAVSIQPVRQ